MPTPPPSAGPYQISKLVRTVFVVALREAFSTDADWPYIANPDQSTDLTNSAIQIIDTRPEEALKYPAVIVSSVLDREGSSIFFEDDLIGEVRNAGGTLVGLEHGGALHLTVNLEVWAVDSISREELADRIYIYLKKLKTVFSDSGIEVRKLSLASPREDEIGTRIHFVAGMNVDTYSEWTYVEDVPESELISKFKVEVRKYLG